MSLATQARSNLKAGVSYEQCFYFPKKAPGPHSSSPRAATVKASTTCCFGQPCIPAPTRCWSSCYHSCLWGAQRSREQTPPIFPQCDIPLGGLWGCWSCLSSCQPGSTVGELCLLTQAAGHDRKLCVLTENTAMAFLCAVRMRVWSCCVFCVQWDQNMSSQNDLRLAGGKQQKGSAQHIPAWFSSLHTTHTLPFCRAQAMQPWWAPENCTLGWGRMGPLHKWPRLFWAQWGPGGSPGPKSPLLALVQGLSWARVPWSKVQGDLEFSAIMRCAEGNHRELSGINNITCTPLVTLRSHPHHAGHSHTSLPACLPATQGCRANSSCLHA